MENEVNNSKCEKGDDKADDGIEDGVFGISNLFAVTARKDVAKTAVNQHNNRNKTNN